MIDPRAVEIVKKFEGFSPHPYTCPAGKLTIGYGSTIWGKRRVWESLRVTEEEAEAQMMADLGEIQTKLADLIRVPVNPPQIGALASFVYNIGITAFKASTLLRLLNAHDYKGAARELDRWVHAGGRKVRGLATRRAAEKELFLTDLPKV